MAVGSNKWLMLIYSVPRHPSASRLYVWRKLKRLGAIMLQDAVWVLPLTRRTREQLIWLAAEIKELKGSVWLWESSPTDTGNEAEMIRKFQEAAQKEYDEILAALNADSRDLAALSRRFQEAQLRDHFHSVSGQQVRAALLAAKERS